LWGVAAVVVAGLGSAYVFSYFALRPYPNDDLGIGGVATQSVGVGQTVLYDVPIPAHRSGAHITAVHLHDTSPGLRVQISSTTFARTAGNDLVGFPASCAGPASTSPVAGTPLNASTYLRIELTPTRPRRAEFTSLTVDWADGLVHGSASGNFGIVVKPRSGYRLRCPSAEPRR
jgi:hypothetical protein